MKVSPARGELYRTALVRWTREHGEISIWDAFLVALGKGYSSSTLLPGHTEKEVKKNIYEMFRQGVKEDGWEFVRVRGAGIDSIYRLKGT